MKKLSLSQTLYPYIIGIDVSKESLDVGMIEVNQSKYESKVLTNTKEGYIKLKKWMKQCGNDMDCQSLFCIEPACRQAYRHIH